MKKIFFIILFCCSCTKQTVNIIPPAQEEKTGARTILHVLILKPGAHPLITCTYHMQEGYSQADSAVIVNQLWYANEEGNHGAPSLHNDYDTLFYGGPGNNKILEIPIDISDLADQAAAMANIERWCDNGYAQHTQKMLNSKRARVKLIYPNL